MKELKFPLLQSQIYLLKTITSEDREVIENYNLWINSVNIDNFIDGDSFGMIPALYKRLSSVDYTDKNINRYLGIYRKSVYKNSIHFHNLLEIGRKLNELDIPFSILKGAAYTYKYHQDIGIRSMNDLDIVVAKENMREAISVLNELGFQNNSTFDICENIDTRHSYDFKNSKNFEVDLHWVSLQKPNKFYSFQKTVQCSHKDISFGVLIVEHSILLLCSHASIMTYTYNIRWIYDLFTILSSDENINWDFVISLAKNKHLSLIMSILFTSYNEISSIKVPKHVITELTKLGNTRLCKINAQKRLQKPKTFIGQLGFFLYSQKHIDKNLFYRLIHFPNHLLMRSHYRNYRELLYAFIKKYILRKKPVKKS